MSVNVLNVQLLQEDLELEQVRVNSLTHMVVVVDEQSGDSATAALESKLQVRLPRRPLHGESLPCFIHEFIFFHQLHCFPFCCSRRVVAAAGRRNRLSGG